MGGGGEGGKKHDSLADNWELLATATLAGPLFQVKVSYIVLSVCMKQGDTTSRCCSTLCMHEARRYHVKVL